MITLTYNQSHRRDYGVPVDTDYYIPEAVEYFSPSLSPHKAEADAYVDDYFDGDYGFVNPVGNADYAVKDFYDIYEPETYVAVKEELSLTCLDGHIVTCLQIDGEGCPDFVRENRAYCAGHDGFMQDHDLDKVMDHMAPMMHAGEEMLETEGHAYYLS